MGLRFRKSIKLAPGVKLNLGSKSAGISVGGKYGGVSYNSRTGARARVSAPGTGISYTTKVGGGNYVAKPKKPVPFRFWYLFLEFLVCCGIVDAFGTDPEVFWGGIIILLVLLAFTGLAIKRKMAQKESQANKPE